GALPIWSLRASAPRKTAAAVISSARPEECARSGMRASSYHDHGVIIAGTMACLIFSDDTGRQIIHGLQEGARVGRAADNDIVALDLRVSRHHAAVVREGETYRIRDMGSSLGVYVNNHRVDECELRDGDLIRLGDSLYTFVNAPVATVDTMVANHPGAAALLGTTLL